MEETLPRRGHKNCCRHSLLSHGDSQSKAKQMNDKIDASVELGQGEGGFHLLDHNQIPDNILRSTIDDYKALSQERNTSKVVQTDPVTFLDTSFFKDLVNNNNHTNASVQATEDSLKGRSMFWRYFWYTIQSLVILLLMSHYHTCVLGFCKHVGSSGFFTTVSEYITPRHKIEPESLHNKIISFLCDITNVITEYVQNVLSAR